MMKKIVVESYTVLDLAEGTTGVQIIVPASLGRTAVHLEVRSGELCISGGSSIIAEIVGEGMTSKVREE